MLPPQRPWIIPPTVSVDKIDKRVTPHGEGMPPSRRSKIARRIGLAVVILVVLAIGAAVAAYFARPGADTERALLPETTVIDGATMFRYDVHKGGLFGPDGVGGDAEWVSARFTVEDDAAAQASLETWVSAGPWKLRSEAPGADDYAWSDGFAFYMDPASARTLYVNWYDKGDQISFDLWVGLVEG